MPFDKKNLLRKLIPKSYSFDGYDAVAIEDGIRAPLFSDHSIVMNNFTVDFLYYPAKELVIIKFEDKAIGRHFQSFDNYQLSIDNLAKMLKEAIQNGADFISFPVTAKWNFGQEVEDEYAAISFNPSEAKEALASYFGITNQSGGKKTMKKKNSLFGLNLKFGLVKDSNIASTIMGIAVKNAETGNWYIYDKAAGTRKNMANIKLGSLPIYMLPVKKEQLATGKLIMYNNEYCFVYDVDPSKNTIKIMNAADGNIREVIPEDSIIPGMSFFTELVAMDMTSLANLGGPNQGISGNIMAAICLMQWSKADNDDESEFSLDDIDDSSFNGLGAALPLLMAGNGNLSNNLLPIMMMSSGDGQMDTMQLLLLSQMMSGSDPNLANPFQNIFPASAGSESNSAGGDVRCEKCNSLYDADTAYCPKCGSKTIPAGSFCRRCGNKLIAGDLFCRKCGTKVAEDYVCPSCGKKLEPGDAFCPGCGTNLKVQAIPVTSQASNENIVADTISVAESSDDK